MSRRDDYSLNFELFMQPLRRSPDMAAQVVEGVKCTLGSMFVEAEAIHDVTLTVLELLDNVHRHADWTAYPPPLLRIWYEMLGPRPHLQIVCENEVIDPEATANRLRKITDGTKDPKAALLLLGKSLAQAHLGDRHGTSPGGMGLLEIASLDRCRLGVRVDRRTFYAEVSVSVPTLDGSVIPNQAI